MAQSNLTPERNARMQDYFTSLAPSYARLTGDTTRSVVDELLSTVKLGITLNSLIHDNACGIGTATDAVLAFCKSRAIIAPKITATDCNEPMIDVLKAKHAQLQGAWSTVAAEVTDSHKLRFKDDLFHYIFCNFSIATFEKPRLALHEIHRTCRPGGIAVVTHWKRFGVAEVMRKAQRKIKGEGHKSEMKEPGADFATEGYIADQMDAVGWERGKIKTIEQRVLVKQGTDQMDGLKEFLSGKWTNAARADWSDEEKSKWSGALDEAIEEEVKQYGGVLFEAWVVLARKWDAMYG